MSSKQSPYLHTDEDGTVRFQLHRLAAAWTILASALIILPGAYFLTNFSGLLAIAIIPIVSIYAAITISWSILQNLSTYVVNGTLIQQSSFIRDVNIAFSEIERVTCNPSGMTLYSGRRQVHIWNVDPGYNGNSGALEALWPTLVERYPKIAQWQSMQTLMQVRPTTLSTLWPTLGKRSPKLAQWLSMATMMQFRPDSWATGGSTILLAAVVCVVFGIMVSYPFTTVIGLFFCVMGVAMLSRAVFHFTITESNIQVWKIWGKREFFLSNLESLDWTDGGVRLNFAGASKPVKLHFTSFRIPRFLAKHYIEQWVNNTRTNPPEQH